MLLGSLLDHRDTIKERDASQLLNGLQKLAALEKVLIITVRKDRVVVAGAP